ncbi:MAG: Tetratricopeptide 2 repeat protein [Bryobacterales bacterium]|nr:Tetratricopeptide 2 repeat protein [Bryobacterales bacterium]
MRLLAILFLSFALVSCSRDPQVVKKRYLDRGNAYFDKSKYREASIMYRSALTVDPKYGDAYYRLSLTSLKQGQVANAVPYLRRAIELLPKGSQQSNDASLNLAEILLLVAQQTDQGNRTQQLIQDVEDITKGFLQRDPKSFEGHKLQADLLFARAVAEYRRNEIVNSKKSMEETIAAYRKTLELRPDDPAIMLSLARALTLYGETGEAETLYRRVVEKGKSGTSGYIELYRLYVAQHKPGEAEAILKKAIAANPKDYTFQTLLAAHYFTSGNKAEGVKMLEGLKSHYHDYPDAFKTAGDFYLRLNDGPTAIKQYEEGVAKDPSRKVEYQKHIIEVLMHDGKTAQAYEKNLEILKANPKDPEARGLKASFLLDKGDITQAVNELQAVVTARPDNYVARFHLGRAHFAKQEFEQARQQFEKAIELRPDYLPPRLALAQVSLVRGDSDSALKYSEQALKLNSQSGAARLLQAAALMRMQKFKESRTTLDQVLSANPKQPDTLLEMGVLNLMEKKYQDAADSFHKAYEADPTNTRGLLGEAEALLLLRQPEKAISLIKAETERFPNRLDLRRDLGDMELRTGQFNEAINVYKDLITRYKDAPRQQGETWARIAAGYYDLKDVPKSIEAYKKAKDFIPENTTVLNNLAILLDNSGQHSEARKVYEQSIKTQPNNPEALNNLAYLMAETGGNLDEALTLANRAKQRLPSLSEVSDTIGWIYLKKNLSDNAADIFKELVAKVPDNSTYHYHYAMALVQKGDKESAAKQCREALAAKPNKEEESRIRDLMSRI